MKSLPHLQNLSWHLDLDNNIFSTLSRDAHNLKSISIVGFRKLFEFELKSCYGLQKLIQSQHQLKIFTMEHVTANMGSLFKLLESQSNSLESIVLKNVGFNSDDLDINPIKFHKLTSIHISNCWISKKGGLRSIFEADLPRLQKLKFENNFWKHNSDWILLQNKYQNQIV